MTCRTRKAQRCCNHTDKCLASSRIRHSPFACGGAPRQRSDRREWDRGLCPLKDIDAAGYAPELRRWMPLGVRFGSAVESRQVMRGMQAPGGFIARGRYRSLRWGCGVDLAPARRMLWRPLNMAMSCGTSQRDRVQRDRCTVARFCDLLHARAARSGLPLPSSHVMVSLEVYIPAADRMARGDEVDGVDLPETGWWHSKSRQVASCCS